MKLSGDRKKNDWKLYICDRESGKEHLLSWGPADEARDELHTLNEKGFDVWLIAPDGVKEVAP